MAPNPDACGQGAYLDGRPDPGGVGGGDDYEAAVPLLVTSTTVGNTAAGWTLNGGDPMYV